MIKIYGHSDDLIEVDGDIRQEYDNYAGLGFIYLSNKVVIKYEYNDDGNWIFVVQDNPNNIYVKINDIGEVDKNEFNGYTQLVEIDEPISWIKFNKKYNPDIYSNDFISYLELTKQEYVESGEELYGDELERVFNDIIERAKKFKDGIHD